MRLVLVRSNEVLREAGVAVVLGLVRKALHSLERRFGGSDDASNAMATAHQQAALPAGLGLGSPGRGCPTGSVWRNSCN
jgi:hypothetical protein